MTDTTQAPPPEEPQMEIHNPKPIHNWRDFLKEVGTIVLGVCIALAAEQGVEWLHWRGQVAEARSIIATELTGNLVGAISRVRAAECGERRLDELALILDQAAKTGSLPPMGDIGMPPRSTWPSGVWDSVVASQTATHFPRQLLANLAETYKGFERLEEFSGREIEAWNELATMIGPGRRLDPASEADLRKALSEARATGRLMNNQSLNVVGRIRDLRLPLSQDDLDREAAAMKRPLASFTQVCAPIGAIPPSYGQAYGSHFRTRVNEAAKKLSDFGGH